MHRLRSATRMGFKRPLLKQIAVRTFTATPSMANKVLTLETLNPKLRDAEYAVRGELVLRSMVLGKKLGAGGSEAAALPFDQIIECNIGNPQQVGQLPISFPRQVIALCTCPEMLESEAVLGAFPADVVERAKSYLNAIPSGTGAYSHSKGVQVVRDEVAAFIEQRDGYPADPEHIFLTNGASPAVQMGLEAIIADENTGVMIPIPQYPLYSAAITLSGGRAVNYYLDEATQWDTTTAELERALAEARKSGTDCRALAVINPGNPTGQVLSRSSMEDILRFCSREKLVLLADEVYQENIWADGQEFTSFKKVLRDLESSGELSAGATELMSFHSVSKGFLGECGRRGGYVELANIDSEVVDQLYKLSSVSLCSNVDGQLMVGLMVNPPRAGDASFERYESEKQAILDSLRRRADRLVAALNKLEGVTCNQSQGALYAFPQIQLPPRAVAAADAAGKPADAFYCLALLEATGIVVVPGSGFGQQDGTFHFRTTILPQEDDMGAVIELMEAFHKDFMNLYRE